MLSTKVEPFYLALGRRIEEVRKKRGLTQEQLGRRLLKPMTRAALSNMETGKQRVLVHVLFDIARVLDTATVDLLPPPAAPVGIAEQLAKLNLSAEVTRRVTERIDRSADEEVGQ